MANPQAFSQLPGIGKAFNELLEDSGMSAIDFTQVITPQESAVAQAEQPQSQAAAQQQLPPVTQ
jgi:histone deacetylase complex regulatory component SIN3